jgi:uncharacterized protein (DUF2141 family)
MSKLSILAAAAAIVIAGAAAGTGAAHAAPLGPHAAACARGGPAMLVRVSGFKARTGTLRIQSYDNPKTFFDKGRYVERVDIAVPAAGPVEVCLPVTRPGTYAVSVRHDANASGKADRSDGGGMSGNPSLSLMDLVFKRKPDASEVAVKVGGGTVPVPVVLNYVQGGSFAPIRTASR